MDCSFDNQDIGCHACGPLIQSLENQLQQLRHENEELMRRVNTLEKSRPSCHQCPLCLKFYGRADALKAHVKYSQDEAHISLAAERYAIETCCSRSFRRRCDLDRHRKGRECERRRGHGGKVHRWKTALSSPLLETVTTTPLPVVSATAAHQPASFQQVGNTDCRNLQSGETTNPSTISTEEFPLSYTSGGLTHGFNPSQSHSFDDGNYAGPILNTNQAGAIAHGTLDASLEHISRSSSDLPDQAFATSQNPFFAPLEETDYSLRPNGAMALEQAPNTVTNTLSTSIQGVNYIDYTCPPHPATFDWCQPF